MGLGNVEPDIAENLSSVLQNNALKTALQFSCIRVHGRGSRKVSRFSQPGNPVSKFSVNSYFLLTQTLTMEELIHLDSLMKPLSLINCAVSRITQNFNTKNVYVVFQISPKCTCYAHSTAHSNCQLDVTHSNISEFYKYIHKF